MDGWAARNAEHREFKIRKVWVRSALSEPNEGFRKINRGTPVLVGNLVLTTNAIDGMVAWNRDSGQEIWRLKTVNGIEGGAAMIRDRVFFGASDGLFYAVDVRNGSILWSVPVRAETLSQPLIDGETGVVYVLTGANVVHAFEADSGKTAWAYTRQDTSSFSIRGGTQPALRAGTLYVGFSDGFFAALNAKNGQVLWEVQLNRNKKFKDIDTTALVDGDRLYVAGYDDRLYCLSAASGEILWKHEAGGYAGLTLQGNKIFYPTSDGFLKALDKTSGKELWSIPVRDGIASTPVPYKGLLVFGESQGELRFIDSTSGREVGSFEPGRGVFEAPAVDEKASRVYFVSNESNVYVLEAQWGAKSAFPWLR